MKKLKTMFALLMALFMLLSMIACDTEKDVSDDNGNDNVVESDKNNENSPAAAESNKSDDKQTEVEVTKELTLDTAEVRLIYYDEEYLAVLYHGPDDDISMKFRINDGSTVNTNISHQFARLKPNYRIVLVQQMPKNYSIKQVELSVKDYSVEGNPERIFTDFENTKPVTREELEALGLYYLNDVPFYITVYAPAYSKYDVEIMMFFTGMFEYDGINNRDWPFTVDSFEAFAGDGTPLGDYFDGYDVEYETKDGKQYIYVVLKVTDGNKSESRNKALCDEIEACNPYVVFTASNGSKVTISLLTTIK